MTCAPSEDSDQPGHPPSLIRVFAVRMKRAWVLSYPLSAQRRLWSYWTDTLADGHPPSLIRVFAVRMKKAWVLSYPLNAQRRLWSYWADVQADLSLRRAHSHIVGFVKNRLIDQPSSDRFNVVLIGLIRKMPTLKPLHHALWNFEHFVSFTKLRNAENLNLVSWIVPQL